MAITQIGESSAPREHQPFVSSAGTWGSGLAAAEWLLNVLSEGGVFPRES